MEQTTENALRESEFRLRAIMEGTTDAVFLKDLQGRYLMINEAGARFLGRAVEDVIGRDDTEMFSPDTAAYIMSRDREVIRSGRTQTFEELGTSDGVTRTYLATKGPYHDAQGRIVGMFGISRDVTEIKRQQQRLDEQRAQLAHMDRVSTLGEMASLLAHDLNNPLTSIISYIAVCVGSLAKPNADRAQITETLEKARAQALHASAIIKRLRGFLRGQDERPMRIDLNAVVIEALELLQPMRKDCKARLELELAPSPLYCEVDRVHAQQVFVNLISNACEALRDNDQPQGLICVRTAMKDGAVLASVRDNVALAEPLTNDVFEAFRTSKPTGLGIGLSICRSFAEQCGGRIWCEPNDPPPGTTFQLRLPADRSVEPVG
jgi:two-component system, LuxR family, sensor kinase FixL